MNVPFLIGVIGLSGVFLAGLSPRYNTGDRAPHSHHVQHEATNHKVVSTSHNHADHNHSALFSTSATANSPTLDFALNKDSVSGWNLHILTTNFRFSPETVNASNEYGLGHDFRLLLYFIHEFSFKHVVG